jgi:hypothetical protein
LASLASLGNESFRSSSIKSTSSPPSSTPVGPPDQGLINAHHYDVIPQTSNDHKVQQTGSLLGRLFGRRSAFKAIRNGASNAACIFQLLGIANTIKPRGKKGRHVL